MVSFDLVFLLGHDLFHLDAPVRTEHSVAIDKYSNI